MHTHECMHTNKHTHEHMHTHAHTHTDACMYAHTPTSAPKAALLLSVACARAVCAGVYCALCANRAMFRSKVLGRAGRRHGYQRRNCDGRAQPRAVWATPRSAERALASDGADDREKRQSDFSFSCVFVTAVNATSRPNPVRQPAKEQGRPRVKPQNERPYLYALKTSVSVTHPLRHPPTAP